VVRQWSAKPLFTGSIPVLALNEHIICGSDSDGNYRCEFIPTIFFLELAGRFVHFLCSGSTKKRFLRGQVVEWHTRRT
jgi:hypothetical protein